MCGITGWIDWNEDLTQRRKILEEMTGKLASRGPDASGYWLGTQAAFGHRRLIVIDPEGGKQPMIRQRGGHEYVLVYNGELYNTAELREALQAEGECFSSYSDTEVVLRAYMTWGSACLSRLNGIYAFAIWDEGRRRLFMARDRMGVKPLFYTERGARLIFGSEIKALLCHPAVKAEVDREGLAEIFGLGPARTPGKGVFKGIFELRPGHYLEYDSTGLRIHKYWQLTSEEHSDDFQTTVEKVRWLVTDAIRRQLVSDVPVGTLLSGGLDSSIISAVVAECYREAGKSPLATFSVDYPENEIYFHADAFQPNSDRPWAEAMAKRLNSDHHWTVIATPQLAGALEAAMRARDLPGMADIDASLLLFCEAIKKEVTVALSGECADEIFGGYPWFHHPDALETASFPWSRSLKLRQQILQPWLQEKLQLESYVADSYQSSLAEVPRLDTDEPGEARRRELFYLNLQWFMTVLLDRKDRMSMATGLEVRVPFCDHRIVEYVWNVPWKYKNWDGREKGLLREAFRPILPGEIAQRKKSPYPKTHRPDYLQTVRERFDRMIGERGPITALIDAEAVKEALKPGDLVTPWFGQLMVGPQLIAFLLQCNDWLNRYNVGICI